MPVFGDRGSTNQRGLTGHTIILARLVEKGYEVLIPWGDHHRYDLAYVDPADLLKGAKLIRIQCKVAWLSPNGSVLRFNTNSKELLSNGRQKRRHYRDDIEYFAVYSPDTSKVYMIPVEDAPEQEMNLRLTKTKNNQVQGVRWAKDYEF